MLCSAGVGFDPIIDGTRVLFDVEGSWRGMATMYDQATQSVWIQLNGTCVSGPRAGTRLKTLPHVTHTTWKRWLQLHPRTTVMDRRAVNLRDGDTYMSRRASASGSPYMPPELRPHLRLEDRRLRPMELLLGLSLSRTHMAFSQADLQLRPVIETEIDGTPISVWFDASEKTAVAFDRRLGDETLTFSTMGRGRFTDQQTGSIWTMDGRCAGGARQGARLRRLQGVWTEWYAWVAVHPDTKVWGERSP